MTRRFGFECEIQAGAAPVVRRLEELGLIPDGGIHSYHCGCNSDGDYMFHVDADEDAEIVSKPLVHGSDEAERAFTELATAMVAGRAQPGMHAGFHVHVEGSDLTPTDTVRLYRLWMRYQEDVAELASASFSDVRNYNAPNRLQDYLGGGRTYDYRRRCYVNAGARITESQFWNCPPQLIADRFQPFGKGPWLSDRRRDGGETFEFRIWNSTRSEWRMRLAVGVSVALVSAAKAGVNVTRDDPRTLVEVLAPFMCADTYAGLVKQAFTKEDDQ